MGRSVQLVSPKGGKVQPLQSCPLPLELFSLWVGSPLISQDSYVPWACSSLSKGLSPEDFAVPPGGLQRGEHTCLYVRVLVRVVVPTCASSLTPPACSSPLCSQDTSACICHRWTPARQTPTAPRPWTSRPHWCLTMSSESLCLQACWR